MKTKSNTTSKSFERIKIEGKAFVGIVLRDSTTSFGTVDDKGILRDLTKTTTSEAHLIGVTNAKITGLSFHSEKK